jgi:hypothetical protein
MADLSDDEKRDLTELVGRDVESTAAMVIGGFDVDELAVANVMSVEDQHYHVGLLVHPISDEKAKEIKEGLEQARQNRGDGSE